MKKPEEKKATPGKYKRERHPDAAWETRWPNICEYMTTLSYDDGSVREPSSISVKIQEGLVLAVMNDPSVTRSIYRSGPTLEEAINAIEEALHSNRADWRVWKESYGSKRRSK